jgi:putative acetyltransferase
VSEVTERPVVISVEPPDRPEIRALIEKLNAYLLSLYRAEDCYHLTIEELCQPDVTFFVARRGGEAVACGALRRLGEGMGEVKRMFTLPTARGAGTGRRILEAIEAEARRHGCDRLVLETGAEQPEALGLYRSAGFYQRGAYGEYREDGASLFMEMRLT